jgi:pyruvate,water dikinase
MAETTFPPRAGATRLVRWPHDAEDRRAVGGKAASLAAVGAARLADCEVPPWFVISPEAASRPEELALLLQAALKRLAPNGEQLAVRSSAIGEDGSESSYAGQLASYLFVRHGDVEARVRDVWRSAGARRVATYEAARGSLSDARIPAVIVQRMVNADAAGVAFSADPVTGQRGIAIVAAVQGVGEALVQGSADADEWRVDRGGRIVDQRLSGATTVLEKDTVVRVAALARAAARCFGSPQDIEWAVENGRLSLLQSRPITSLRTLPDPDGALALWDNSNIVESYGGVTTPLTYSFARHAYEQVYRRFLLLLGVTPHVVEANADSLRRMIGLIRGRVYYNLVSWYRALALLPGYSLNRRFMEQMMGVREGIPDGLVPLPTSSRARSLLDVARAAWGLSREHARIRESVEAFHARIDHSLAAESAPLEEQRADELVAQYRRLEADLLARWDAPLLNDFFAMIHFGVLRTLARKWCADADGTLPNDLVAGDRGMISAQPAQAIARMAAQVVQWPSVRRALCGGTETEALGALAEHPGLYREYSRYLERFGDRCAEELKLETRTLAEEPLPLLRAIGRAASAPARSTAGEEVARIRAEAEARVARALRSHPIRRFVFAATLARARARMRDRENLRFERTRVFGRVRRIVIELGKRFAAQGLLDDARDVFYLEIHEVLGAVEGTATSLALRELAIARQREFDEYRGTRAPGARFGTRGMVHEGNTFTDESPNLNAPTESVDSRRGTGCYPGIVRGLARVVRDPREAMLLPGEVLVAEHTDPGWVMLFPAAAGLLVERGSLLSHSAIVSRELGIASIVGVPGLTGWLRTGDLVELDGRSGTVRLIARWVSNEADGPDVE